MNDEARIPDWTALKVDQGFTDRTIEAYQKLAAFYYMKAMRAADEQGHHERSIVVYQRSAAKASAHARIYAGIESVEDYEARLQLERRAWLR